MILINKMSVSDRLSTRLSSNSNGPTFFLVFPHAFGLELDFSKPPSPAVEPSPHKIPTFLDSFFSQFVTLLCAVNWLAETSDSLFPSLYASLDFIHPSGLLRCFLFRFPSFVYVSVFALLLVYCLD